MYKYLLVIWLITGCAFAAMAQNPDTTASAAKSKKDTLTSTRQDTVVSSVFKPKKAAKEKMYHPDTLHSPSKAVWHSIIVPGWGQLYNHQWWMLPIIYGGMGLIADAYLFNAKYYREFLALSIYREHGVNVTPKDPYYNEFQLYAGVDSQSIYNAKDGYRRNRDLSILGFFGAWAVNAVQAYIQAKFIHSFTVDSNLSMQVTPGMINQPMYAQNPVGSFIPAIKITFTL